MITLYFKEGTSDKVYQVSVDPTAGGYDVNFAYGRRGSTMNVGKKNTSPLPQSEAQKIADKLVKEKMAKGYTPGPDGAVYKNTDKEDRFTGILPMLLNAIPEEEVHIFTRKDNWMMQPKYDGKRMMLQKEGSKIRAINRSGLIVGAPQGFLEALVNVPGDFILDGEAVGEKYIAFDLLQPGMPLRERLQNLEAKLLYADARYITLAPAFVTTETKLAFLNYAKENRYEGVVFKELGSLYHSGRPSTGGVALKCKFTATANVWVTGVNIQRSVQIQTEDGTPCGNVTVPPNRTIPKLGDIIEVRYLYAMPGSNALYQPVYSRLRDDINVADEVTSLKYKREED